MDVRASFIVGGQVAGGLADVFQVHPEGNYIAATAATPYLQIDEVKYGRPILDRVVGGGCSLELAGRVDSLELPTRLVLRSLRLAWQEALERSLRELPDLPDLGGLSG